MTSAPTPHAVPHSLSELPARGRVRCSGVISAVTIEPASASPTYAALLVEPDAPGVERPRGPGRLRLLWLGRRRVPGIGVGTHVRVEGMVALRDGVPTIFNPRYEIIQPQES